jgi:hypothetical protein
MTPSLSPIRASRTVLAVAVLTLGLATPLALTSSASASRATSAAATSSLTRVVKAGKSTNYHATRQGGKAVEKGQEVRPTGGGADPDVAGATHGSPAIGTPLLPHRFSAPAPAAEQVKSSRVVADGTVSHGRPGLLRSFEGLNHYDTRFANNGNQFSNEPPDQGLCVGKGQVVEVVNDVIRVYNEHGKPVSGKAEDLNTFLGYRAAINRTTGKTGPDVFDPTCLYDPTTKQFFVVTDTLLADPDSGNLTGRALINISVAADPTGKWKHYTLDVTNDGSDGTPAQAGCPCFGDYPHIGVDANGFYITTNDFPLFQGGFNGSQIYAFDKRALARHEKKVFVTEFDTNKSLGGEPGFTIWPAQSPVTSQYDRRHGGTAYFLSSTNATTRDGSSDTIAVWALTHTNSFGDARPSAILHDHQVGVHRYAFPPHAIQPDGPLPLLKCLNDETCATTLNGEPDPYTPETEQTVDSNDGRMQQVTYSQGMLYGALDTAVRSEGVTSAGVAWFVIKPRMSQGKLHASVVKQGKIAIAGENVVYPAMGITSSGHGIIAFTLVGPDYYPSAAWTTFDARRGAGLIQVAAAGRAPEDGFSGYRYYSASGPGIARPRWGDYGATAVDGNKIWAASEYIAHTCGFKKWQQAPLGTCGGKRSALANWSTRISLIRP